MNRDTYRNLMETIEGIRLSEAEENIYKRAAPAWRRKRSVGGTPEVSLDIQTDIPRLPGATSYLDNDNISIYAWVRPHKFSIATPMSPGKTYRYEAFVSISYGNHEEALWSYHSDDPRKSFQRYAPYEGEAVKMCEDFIERGLRALISVKPELAKFVSNWRNSSPRFQTGTPYLK